MKKIEQQRKIPPKKRGRKSQTVLKNANHSKRNRKKRSSFSKKTSKAKKKEAYRKRTRLESRRFLASRSTVVFVLLFIFCGYFFWNYSAHRVDGVSMEPTFQNNDRILLRKTNVLKRYEIITFRPKDTEDSSYIKRIIGIPGDYIWIAGNNLFLLPEGSAERPPEAPKAIQDMPDSMLKIAVSDATAEELSVYKMIPENHYFVQGDNRSHSNDSRDFGLVSSEQVEGVVCYRYFPFNNLSVPY